MDSWFRVRGLFWWAEALYLILVYVNWVSCTALVYFETNKRSHAQLLSTPHTCRCCKHNYPSSHRQIHKKRRYSDPPRSRLEGGQCHLRFRSHCLMRICHWSKQSRPNSHHRIRRTRRCSGLPRSRCQSRRQSRHQSHRRLRCQDSEAANHPMLWYWLQRLRHWLLSSWRRSCLARPHRQQTQCTARP